MSGFNSIGEGMTRVAGGSDDLWRDYIGSYAWANVNLMYGQRDTPEAQIKWEDYLKSNCNEEVGITNQGRVTGSRLTDPEPTYFTGSSGVPLGACLQKCPTGFQKKWVEYPEIHNAHPAPGYWL